MAKNKTSNYPLRADEITWERVRETAQLRGAPISVVMDRLLAWFVDQTEQKQAEIMRYGVPPRTAKRPLKVARATPEGYRREIIE